MKKAGCVYCGRRRPYSNLEEMRGTVATSREDGGGMDIRVTLELRCASVAGCWKERHRQRAQVRRQMLGDVHLRRLLYITEVRA